jgi:hypothetical protein
MVRAHFLPVFFQNSKVNTAFALTRVFQIELAIISRPKFHRVRLNQEAICFGLACIFAELANAHESGADSFR